jgi:hypothetical protein
MHRRLTTLFALVGLTGCVSQQNTIPFARAQAGDFALTTEISVIGVLDTTGVNFYSLFMDDSQRASPECIPLILDRQDQTLAKRLSGRRAIVSGRAIPMDELNQALPNEYGEINGREWSGTRCTGRIAIYVTALETVK